MLKECVIDLGAIPKLPFAEAVVKKHVGNGVVKIELRPDDNLYINGKRYDLFWTEKQKNGSVSGHELRAELEESGGLLNINVLRLLFEHPEMYPEHWKKDEEDNGLHVIFLDSIFSGYPKKDSLCVSSAGWNVDRVLAYYQGLDDDYGPDEPALRLVA